VSVAPAKELRCDRSIAVHDPLRLAVIVRRPQADRKDDELRDHSTSTEQYVAKGMHRGSAAARG